MQYTQIIYILHSMKKTSEYSRKARRWEGNLTQILMESKTEQTMREKSITCDVTVSLTAAELGEMILVVL